MAGDIWAVPAFLIAAPEPVFAFGKRPGVHLREEPTRRRCGARGACGGPAAPSPHRRPGAGRGADGAARRRGGSAAGTARSSWRAGGDRGSVARCLSGPVWIQLASGCAFSAHFLLVSGRGNELLGEGRERLRPPGPRRTSSLSRAGGYAENARSGRGPQELPGRGARRGLRAGAGRRARAGAPDGRRRRRKDGGAPEPCHSTSAWSGASPTPWPWLR